MGIWISQKSPVRCPNFLVAVSHLGLSVSACANGFFLTKLSRLIFPMEFSPLRSLLTVVLGTHSIPARHPEI
jgi:hypothetical protein